MKHFVFEKVSTGATRGAGERMPRTTGRDDWTGGRAAANDDDELLQPATLEWFYDLPPALQPHALAGHFVRIANRVCALWTQPVRCASYLAELTSASRSERQRLPLAVAREIDRLAAYHATLGPAGHSRTLAR